MGFTKTLSQEHFNLLNDIFTALPLDSGAKVVKIYIIENE